MILDFFFAITDTGDVLLPANKKPEAIGTGAVMFSICIKSPFSSVITVFASPSIKIFEKLVAVDPRNTNFVGYLAQSYLLRGWHKKAVDTFKDAISFDEKNTFLWLGLSEAYMAGEKLWEAKEALQAALSGDQKEEDLTFTIYYKLLIIDITIFEPESMKENLKHVYELASAMPEEKDEIGRASCRERV